MIWLGVELVSRFHFALYLFGAFLLITERAMLIGKSEGSVMITILSSATALASNGSRNLRLSRTKVYRPRRRPADADSARPRPLSIIETMDLDFRGRFDSGSPRDHPRHLHCLYLQHLRDPRLACSLYFSPREPGHPFIYLRIGLAIILCFVGIKMLVEPCGAALPSWLSGARHHLSLILSTGGFIARNLATAPPAAKPIQTRTQATDAPETDLPHSNPV